MPDAIPCPACFETVAPAAQIGPVAVCGACGASLVVDASGIRRASAADTTILTPEARQTLQKARGRIARPERRQR